MTRLARRSGTELMDAPGQDRAELARSLADLRAVNRWLGGTRVVLHHLSRLAAAHPRPSYRILDVATGSGDIPLAVVRWARARGTGVRIVATDNHATTLDLARANVASEPEVTVASADALDLPYADGAFDVALCSTALHHFDREEDAVRVLRELDRVARVGVIVNDLRRSWPALVGARLLAATVWRTHPVTRHDGPLSVRRSLTPAELRRLADAAGLRGATVYAHVPFRLALVVDKGDRASVDRVDSVDRSRSVDRADAIGSADGSDSVDRGVSIEGVGPIDRARSIDPAGSIDRGSSVDRTGGRG